MISTLILIILRSHECLKTNLRGAAYELIYISFWIIIFSHMRIYVTSCLHMYIPVNYYNVILLIPIKISHFVSSNNQRQWSIMIKYNYDITIYGKNAAWGCSSNGRALALHARGKRFDTPHLQLAIWDFVCFFEFCDRHVVLCSWWPLVLQLLMTKYANFSRAI